MDRFGFWPHDGHDRLGPGARRPEGPHPRARYPSCDPSDLLTRITACSPVQCLLVPRRVDGLDALISSLLSSCPPPLTKNRNPELTPFQRRYVWYVRRCDELERKLRFFAERVRQVRPDPGRRPGTSTPSSSPTRASSAPAAAWPARPRAGRSSSRAWRCELEGYEKSAAASSTPTPRSSRGSTTRRSSCRRCWRRPGSVLHDGRPAAGRVSELSTGRVSFRLILARSGMRGLLVYYIMHYAGANCSSS